MLLGPKSETETYGHRKDPDAGTWGHMEANAIRREPRRQAQRRTHAKTDTRRDRQAETATRRDTRRRAHSGSAPAPPTRHHPRPAPLTEAADLSAQADAAVFLGYGAQHVLQRAFLGLGAARRLGGGGGGGGGEGGRPGPEPRGRRLRGAGPARRPRRGHAGPRFIARAAPAGVPGVPRRLRPGAARREHQ